MDIDDDAGGSGGGGKKVDCPTDSWLIDTYLCSFYSLITTLDSMEKKKL